MKELQWDVEGLFDPVQLSFDPVKLIVHLPVQMCYTITQVHDCMVVAALGINPNGRFDDLRFLRPGIAKFVGTLVILFSDLTHSLLHSHSFDFSVHPSYLVPGNFDFPVANFRRPSHNFEHWTNVRQKSKGKHRSVQSSQNGMDSGHFLLQFFSIVHTFVDLRPSVINGFQRSSNDISHVPVGATNNLLFHSTALAGGRSAVKIVSGIFGEVLLVAALVPVTFDSALVSFAAAAVLFDKLFAEFIDFVHLCLHLL
jgi:hypothetical protein